jgi:arylsulfatase A-like enzyme
VAASAPPRAKVLDCESATRLDTAFPTLGKMFKSAGYATAHFGKWHLGPVPYSPLQHGFDIDIPHWPGPGPAGNYMAPWQYERHPQSKDFKAKTPLEHIEDRMGDEAVQWLRSLSDDRPFFMNYWMFSVHSPLDAKPDLVEKYRALIKPGSAQRSPTYAAMVQSMDEAVGKLLDAVDEAGIADRTIIVFMSDNGGVAHLGLQETDADGREYRAPATSNAPLRGGKATIYDGGIRVPCVVVWPGVTEPGSRSDAMIQSTDFYPTLLNGTGIALPDRWTLDGRDFSPALQGRPYERDPFVTYFPYGPPVADWLPPSVAVHAGDWKLIRLFYQGDNGAHDYRLYHLKEDSGEKKNLAAKYPEKVSEMDRLISRHLEETAAVRPQPNPAFDPAEYQPDRIGVQAGGLNMRTQVFRDTDGSILENPAKKEGARRVNRK